MTASQFDESFLPGKQSIRRATDSINEFNEAARRFFGSGVHKVVTEPDTRSGEYVQKIRLTKPLPKALNRKASEALYYASHSFDQSLSAAGHLLAGRARKSVEFPWAQSLPDLNRLCEERQIDPRLWSTIARYEPYRRGDANAGGDDVACTLAQMANRKNTVGLSVVCHMNPGPAGRGWDPVKNEMELARSTSRADLKVRGDNEFTFQIVFSDRRLTQPVDVVSSLTVFTRKAQAVLEGLKGRCIELLGD